MKPEAVFQDAEQVKIINDVAKELTDELGYEMTDQMMSVLMRGFIEGKDYVRKRFIEQCEHEIKHLMNGG